MSVAISMVLSCVTLGLWMGMIYGLTKLKTDHDTLPDDLDTLDNEALLAFIAAKYHVSEYRLFEAESRARFGRVIEAYVDSQYAVWLRQRKMPDNIRAFMIDVLEGREPFQHTLIV